MHSAKGHTVVDERWRLELTVAAVYRAFAPRASECLVPALPKQAPAQKGESFRAISYYSYRYL